MMSPAAITPQYGDALILVDVQNDFLPGGKLGVAQGNAIIPVLNRHIADFRAKGLPIYATRDWHPEYHCSFKAQGGPWPPHCIAGSKGAQFATELELPGDTIVISKATTADKDAYSGFQDTDLDQRLREHGSKRLFIGGLATDYCALNTVKDALALGFEVIVLRDAVRAVNLQPNDGHKALQQMQRLGARLVNDDVANSD